MTTAIEELELLTEHSKSFHGDKGVFARWFEKHGDTVLAALKAQDFVPADAAHDVSALFADLPVKHMATLNWMLRAAREAGADANKAQVEPVDVRRKTMVMTEAETDALVVHWGFDDVDRALQNMALEIERLRAAPRAAHGDAAFWMDKYTEAATQRGQEFARAEAAERRLKEANAELEEGRKWFANREQHFTRVYESAERRAEEATRVLQTAHKAWVKGDNLVVAMQAARAFLAQTEENQG